LGNSNVLKDINENAKQDKAVDNNDSITHSRLLTKKQLVDMAWGVRELSKTLGSIRMRLKVMTVFLLTKAHDENLIGYTREVVEWLLSKDRTTPYIVFVFQCYWSNTDTLNCSQIC
jgi:NAD+ kinase